MIRKVIALTGILLLLSISVYGKESSLKAQADILNAQGQKVGASTLVETPHGVLITTELMNMPPGVHAFHLHGVGKCEPPFKSAGGHFNPLRKEHGIMNPKGMHAGDLPNIHVGKGGKLTFEVLASQVTLGEGKNSLFDGDGSAIVIHKGADDYMSNPAGSAGPRIACGVISR